MDYSLYKSSLIHNEYINIFKDILIEKGITTEEEIDKRILKRFEENPTTKREIEYCDFMEKMEAILKKSEITDDDLKYIRTEGIKFDTSENIEKLVTYIPYLHTIEKLKEVCVNSNIFSKDDKESES